MPTDTPELVRPHNVLAYENKLIMEPLIAALRAECNPGERVIWRDAFRWKDENGVLSNQYEMFSLEEVAEGINAEIIYHFTHAAIVRPKAHADADLVPW